MDKKLIQDEQYIVGSQKYKQFDTVQAIEWFGKEERGFIIHIDNQTPIIWLAKNGILYQCRHETMLPCRVVLTEKKYQFDNLKFIKPKDRK